jgi:hypothetical protein
MITVGAVLRKIKILGFGGPGLKIHVLKGHSHPAPVVEGEGRIYNVFLAHGHFEILGGMPENTQSDVFLGAFNGFLAGEPRLGCRKVDFLFLSV